MLIKGVDLNPQQRCQVLAAFVHRHTVEHPYPISRPGKPTQTDDQWLASLAFHFIKDGSRLAGNRRHAEPVFRVEE